MAVFGYARVSTLGQSLEDQINTLNKLGVDKVYSEKESARSVDRPELVKLLDDVVQGDTIVITRIDRFARSTVDALLLVEELTKKGVGIKVLDIGGQTLDTSTPVGKVFVTMLISFAQYERELIIERMAEGKARAKLNPSFREGRTPTYTKKRVETAYKMYCDGLTYQQVSDRTGISVSTLKRRFKELRTQEEEQRVLDNG